MRFVFCFFFQAEDGIRDLVRSRGLGDVYKRQRAVGAARDRVFIDTVPRRKEAAYEVTFLPARSHDHLSLIHI